MSAESSRYYSVTISPSNKAEGEFYLRVERGYGVREYAEQNRDYWQAHWEKNGMAAAGTRQVVITQEQLDAYKEVGWLGLGEIFN
jgi:hypothetical protein